MGKPEKNTDQQILMLCIGQNFLCIDELSCTE